MKRSSKSATTKQKPNWYQEELRKHNKQNSKKFENPQESIYNIDARSLKNLVVYECKYNEYGHLVCPFCGQDDKRTLAYDYTVSAEDKEKGELWGIAACRICRTIFKYYFN